MTTYQPAGIQLPVGKQRNGIAVALLSIVTFGIYWLVYLYKTHDELKRHTGNGIGGGVAVLVGLFVGIVSPFLLGNEVGSARQARGLPQQVSALTAFWMLLPLIGGFVFAAKVQSALNDYWVAAGAPRR
ncbi:MAG TPA: DUF4234 domain-containing protein [Jatrophihabitans sp.]|nr:DUF4234 domain-containing protein [Jatrophihabitans sp.]